MTRSCGCNRCKGKMVARATYFRHQRQHQQLDQQLDQQQFDQQQFDQQQLDQQQFNQQHFDQQQLNQQQLYQQQLNQQQIDQEQQLRSIVFATEVLQICSQATITAVERVLGVVYSFYLHNELPADFPTTFAMLLRQAEVTSSHRTLDVCINECIIFIDELTTVCGKCGEARRVRGKARLTFRCIDVVERLRLIYKNPFLSRMIRHSSQHTSPSDISSWRVWREKFVPKFGGSDLNIALGLMMDGVKLFEHSKRSNWIISLSVLNFPSW